MYFHKQANYFYLLLLLFITSCAQIVAPGGGKVDKTPPVVKQYIPDSAQLNFSAQKIQIVFDEYIELKDINQQLIISPPLAVAPDITVKNKTLTIALDEKEKLKPNTTYCISFGNSIRDITENNAKENFTYLFSTGSYIDSLRVAGKVQSAFNHKTEKGILVMLYRNANDSAAYKAQPNYFAKTKEDGTFLITNISAGKYTLIALKDANSNYKYDEGENIAFTDSLVDVSKPKNIPLNMFEEVPKKLMLKKASYNSYGKIVFLFNKPNDSITIQPINYTFKEGDVLLDYSANRDTLNYWFRNIDKDMLRLQISNGAKIIDTLEYKLITREEALKTKRNKFQLNLVNNFNGNRNFDLNKQLVLVFNHPIESITSGTIFKEDTITLSGKNKLVYYTQQGDKPEIRRIGIQDSVNYSGDNKESKPKIYTPVIKAFSVTKENTNYHIFIPPATFTDFFGLTNDTIKLDFKTQEEKYYGSIKLKLNMPQPKKGFYILQIMDDKENIISESPPLFGAEVLNYQYLYPRQYKLKLIVDKNENRKYDSGNYLHKTQPEKVIYYDGEINLRSNWDLDLEWKLKQVE